MKKLLSIAILFLILSGCKKECSPGYEGDGCKTETRIKYYGSYVGVWMQNGANVNGTVVVSAVSGSSTDIQCGAVKAKPTDNKGNYTVPVQTVVNGGTSYNVSGTVNFTDNYRIIETFTFTGIGYSETQTFVGQR